MASYTSPKTEKMSVIYCHRCSTYYVDSKGDLTCLVAHGPNSCCHYGDISVTKEQFTAALEALGLRKSKEVV